MRPDKRHSYGMFLGKKFVRKHEDKHTRAPQIKPSESEAKFKSEKMASVFGRRKPKMKKKLKKTIDSSVLFFSVNKASVFLCL